MKIPVPPCVCTTPAVQKELQALTERLACLGGMDYLAERTQIQSESHRETE
jgi:hypothetical protein